MAKRRRDQAATPRAQKAGSAAPVRPATGFRPDAAAARRRAAASGSNRDRGVLAIVALTVLAAVSVIGFALFTSSGGTAGNYTCGEQLVPQQGATVADPIIVPDEGNAHVPRGTRLSFLNCPPASGNHNNIAGIAPARPAYYAPDADIGPGSWVHNLEHGYAVVLYRCTDDICPPEDVVADLRAYIAQAPPTTDFGACGWSSKVLVARFDDMATPYAFLAWGRVLLQEEFDLPTALDFARTWIGKTGPENTRC